MKKITATSPRTRSHGTEEQAGQETGHSCLPGAVPTLRLIFIGKQSFCWRTACPCTRVHKILLCVQNPWQVWALQGLSLQQLGREEPDSEPAVPVPTSSPCPAPLGFCLCSQELVIGSGRGQRSRGTVNVRALLDFGSLEVAARLAERGRVKASCSCSFCWGNSSSFDGVTPALRNAGWGLCARLLEP